MIWLLVPIPLPVSRVLKEPYDLVRSDGCLLHTGSLEDRQTSGLGRHGHMYCG